MNAVLQRQLNKRGNAVVLVAQTRANHELRSEWEGMLRFSESLKSHHGDDDSMSYLQREIDNVRTLLGALDAKVPEGRGFVCEFYSVGNPDFGQYHGAGIGSPTFTVEAPDLLTLVRISQAYIAAYDLGSGNCPTFEVYHDGVEVAHISYNGRMWTPHKFGDPRRREIDPETGKEAGK